MGLVTRKSALRIENIIREKNASAFVSVLSLFLSIFSKDRSRKLSSFSGFLAHFPKFIAKPYVFRALKKISLKDTGVYDIELSNSIIIKDYVDAKEKGLILISFERELEKICTLSILKAVESKYHIIFIPSWSGLFSPALFSLSFMATQPFFVMPVHRSEHLYAKYLGDYCVPLDFNAASWVNHELFQQTERNRDIDCLIVANFAKFKRHWLLFDSIARTSRDVKVLCIGVPWGGRGKKDIEDEARLFKVEGKVVVMESPDQEKLREYFQRAKYFCAMSYREGSFIAVAEALIAGTPVLMFDNSYIGTKSLLNPSNSIVVSSSKELARVLNCPHYKFNNEEIRKRSIETFSSFVNCERLNNDLRSYFKSKTDSEWTKDIVQFYSTKLCFFYANDMDLSEVPTNKVQFDKFFLKL